MPSLTSQIGIFGVAMQTAFAGLGTASANALSVASASGALGAAGGYTFMPMMAIPQLLNRAMDNMPVEINGQRGDSGAYVKNYVVGGEIDMLFRTRPSLFFWESLLGTRVSTATTGATADAATKFSFGNSETYKYLSLIRNIGDKVVESHQDIIVDGVTVTMRQGEPVSLKWGIVGLKGQQLNVTATAANNPAVTAQWDRNKPLAAVGDLGKISLTGLTLTVLNAELTIQQNTTRDEFCIGSYYVDDMTKLGFSVGLTCDVAIKNADLYQKVQYNSATYGDLSLVIPSIDSSTLEMKSPDLMSTINRSCKITIGTLELLSLPLQLAGNNLLRGTLTARGKIPASGYNIACEIITNAA